VIPRRLRRAALLAVLAAAGAWVALRPGAPTRRDIVLVVWDAGRADRLSAYGYAKDTTPWLRSFAQGAVTFRRAFTPHPWSPAAHGALLSGMRARRHGLRQGVGDRVAEEVPLLAETLRDAGYETVGFVANGFLSSETGLDAGFERLVPLHLEGPESARADRVIAEVDAWLLERRNAPPADRRPLFVLVNFMDLHLPRRPPAEDLAAIAGAAGPSPALERALEVDERDALAHVLGIEAIDPETVAAMGTVYDAAARHLDRRTGELLDRLEAGAIGEDAVVAVVADHGEHLGEHGFLGHEMSLYDPVLHVPMVLRWPGRFDDGREEEAQVRLQDLHPTLLEAAGLPVPPDIATDAAPLTETPIRPRLLRAAFHRPTAYLDEARVVFAGAPPEAFDRYQVSLHGVRESEGARGPFKFLIHVRKSGDGPATTECEEFYDLGADPDEREDLVERGRESDLEEGLRLWELIEQ